MSKAGCTGLKRKPIGDEIRARVASLRVRIKQAWLAGRHGEMAALCNEHDTLVLRAWKGE